MSTIQEIEQAIQNLAPGDLTEFRRWFAEYDAAKWDEEIERDATSGRLDALAREAREDFRQGRCKSL